MNKEVTSPAFQNQRLQFNSKQCSHMRDDNRLPYTDLRPSYQPPIRPTLRRYALVARCKGISGK